MVSGIIECLTRMYLTRGKGKFPLRKRGQYDILDMAKRPGGDELAG
jgi:hypothetical protein